MVSEKLIIVLITLAILMSVASIVITVSTLNTSMIPEIKPQLKVIEGRDSGKVSIGIIKPTVLPTNPVATENVNP